MRNKLLSTLLLCICAFGANAQPFSNCSAMPDPVTISQPDGSRLTIVGKGSSLLSYSESQDGYTLYLNDKGIYEYAIPYGDDLVGSGQAAHEPALRTATEKAFLSGITSHLRYGAGKVALIVNNARAQYKNIEGEPDKTEVPTVQGSFPHSGKRKVLVLLIKFPDLNTKYLKSDFEDMMNKPDYKGTGSFRDYYLANSFNKLDLNTDVFGWYTAKYGYTTYGRVNSDNSKAVPLISEAIDAAHKAGVNFSQYDNDKDGKVDGIIVVHSGPGAEEGGTSSGYIWSHRYNLYGGNARTYDGVKISSYTIQPETRGSSSRMVGIGVFCHEFGHILGLPDLYDVNYVTAGDGDYELMAGGNWLNYEATPATYSAFSKTWLGWIKPIVINKNGAYTLKPSATDSTVFRVNTSESNEYFLLENKQYVGFDAALPARGLAIWHVDSDIMSYTSQAWGYNSVNTDSAHKGLDLEEADGKFDLDKNKNRGDLGDLYPGYYKKTQFGASTLPNSKLYTGANSKIEITKITQNTDANNTVSFNFGSVPAAKIDLLAPVVCANAPFNFENGSVFAENYYWSFGDGNSDTSSAPEHTYATPGTYTVKLKASTLAGDVDYDSVNVTVSEKPQAGFNMTPNALTVNINNTSKDGANYTWYWGDGRVSYTSNPTFSRTYSDSGKYELKLIVANQYGCKDSTLMTVWLGAFSVGINNNSANSIQMKAYPNPYNAEMTFEFYLDISQQTEIALYNLEGQKIGQIQSGLLDAGKHSFTEASFPKLSSGVYLVGIRNIKGMHYLRLIKN